VAEKEKKKAGKARALKRTARKPAPAPVKAQAKAGAAKAPRKPPARARASSRPEVAEPGAVLEPKPRAPRPRRQRRAAPAPLGFDGPLEVATPGATLTEEERIESSKYDVRERPRRVFEEERFLFPETYQADRVRLLVKDPEWLFAHWDVSPGSLQRLRDDLGERATALSRLTLRLEDPADSALSVVLLPEGARSWYVRTHAVHRAYRASLGVTMPSGEFRALATSNVVEAPRVGPSPQRAKRRADFSRAQAAQTAAELERAGATPSEGKGAPVHAANAPADSAEPKPGVDYIDGGAENAQRSADTTDARGGASEQMGGASDVFRR
jgi:hypothetical protein